MLVTNYINHLSPTSVNKIFTVVIRFRVFRAGSLTMTSKIQSDIAVHDKFKSSKCPPLFDIKNSRTSWSVVELGNDFERSPPGALRWARSRISASNLFSPSAVDLKILFVFSISERFWNMFVFRHLISISMAGIFSWRANGHVSSR